MIKRDSTIGVNEDRKLAFSFGALVLALMLIVSVTMLYLYHYQQMREENRLSGAIAGIMSESISRVSFSGKYHARLLVEEMKAKVPVVESISVEAFDGRIIANSDPLLNDSFADNSEPAISEELFKAQNIFSFEHRHKGRLIKEIIIPFREGLDNNPAGIVRIGIDIHNSRKLMKINYVVLTFLILLFTSAAIWIVFRLSRYFGRKVRNLAIQMQAVLDTSPALIYMKDSEGRYLFINRLWGELFNTTNDKVRGKTDLDMFPEEIAHRFMQNDRQVIDNEKRLEVEEFAPLEDGIHTYNTIKVPVYDSSGRIYALCGISTDITERKLAENSLRASEERFKNLVAQSPFSIQIMDTAGRTIQVNKAFEKLWGVTIDELDGYTILQDRQLEELGMMDYIKKGFSGESATLPEIEYNGSNTIGKGAKCWIKANIYPIKDDKGNITSVVLIHDNITEQKKAEFAQKETEEIFNHFMENSPIYVFFKDENIRPIKLSKNYEEMLGMPLDNILGKTMDELFPSDLAKSMIEDDRHVLMEGKTISIDEELNGRYYTTIKFPISIDGMPRYLAGYTIDITERKLAEQAIDAERERLLVTLRSIGDAVITTDIDGNIMLMNRVAEELTGWTAREAAGIPLMKVFDIVNEITGDAGENPVQKVMNGGGIVELPQQTILINRDGSERLIADSAAPITGSDSGIIGIVLVFRDITEKRKTEVLIQNTQKLESLGVLAGGIAHDFNNLLGGLFGYIELMKLQIGKNDMDKISETADRAMQVFNRTKALTQQLLTFAKGGEPLKKTINLKQMLISGTQFVLSGTKVTCNFNIQPDLWPCIADENQIGQVLDNIIINAIQAMPMGGEITIKADNIVISSNDSVHYLSPGHYVRVSITDQGTGIPDSLLSRIFDPFYTTKSTGTGLGLATSYSIIKKHGGTITADSREGEWSTFTFYLPSALDNATETSITSYDKMPSFTGKVLVMDDEEFIRLTTKKLLEAVGIEVDTASHGEEAISIYRSAISTGNPYSAVILDLTVKGGLGGKETVTILRSIDPEVPVIASSGYSADPVMANPALYGFNDRLIKPYTLEDLIIILKKLKISSNR